MGLSLRFSVSFEDFICLGIDGDGYELQRVGQRGVRGALSLVVEWAFQMG